MKGLGNAEIFARNLRHYVEQSGKLGKDIAAAIGVAPATFSEWANGKKYPRIDKIEMLANYFKIQKSDLIENHENNEQITPGQTPTFRIISSGLSELPQEEQEKILNILRAMYANRPELFKRERTNDDTGL